MACLCHMKLFVTTDIKTNIHIKNKSLWQHGRMHCSSPQRTPLKKSSFLWTIRLQCSFLFIGRNWFRNCCLSLTQCSLFCGFLVTKYVDKPGTVLVSPCLTYQLSWANANQRILQTFVKSWDCQWNHHLCSMEQHILLFALRFFQPVFFVLVKMPDHQRESG